MKAAAIIITTIIAISAAKAGEYEEQQLGDLRSEVEELEIDKMNREWDEIQQHQQRKMQEIQAETDRNLEAGRRSQQTRLLALKLAVDRIRERQPAAKSAVVHFIDGYSKVNREMDKPEAMRSVQVVREGLAEHEEGMKQLRALAITPLPLEDRTTMLVCYGESKPGARDRELKSLVNSLWHVRWRFEKRDFHALSDSRGTAGIWIVKGKIYLP